MKAIFQPLIYKKLLVKIKRCRFMKNYQRMKGLL